MKILISTIAALLLITSTIAIADGQVLLGERHVNDLSERDTIKVGADRGKFKALKVKASGAAIEFKHVVVHFKNGDEQVFAKNRVLGRGDKSGNIDLNGDSRYIEKVVFHYEARSKGWKGADLKLFGIRP